MKNNSLQSTFNKCVYVFCTLGCTSLPHAADANVSTVDDEVRGEDDCMLMIPC